MKILARTPSTLVLEHRPVFYRGFAAVFAVGLPALLALLAPRGWLLGSAVSALAGVSALVLWGSTVTVSFDREGGTVEVARTAPWGTARRVRLGLDEVARVTLDSKVHHANAGNIVLYGVVLESTLGERIPLTAGDRLRAAGLTEPIEAMRAFLRSARPRATDGARP